MSWSETRQQREARETIADLTRQRDSARAWAEQFAGEVDLLLWLHAESEWKRTRRGYVPPVVKTLADFLPAADEAQRESVADAAEGDEAAVWVPQVGERVTGMGCGTGIICELPRAGLYMGTGESFKGRATAWLHDGGASPVLAYADTLRPAPSEREGDKQ